jgi:hypothetical protein
VGLACQADGRAGLGDEATTRRKLRAARQYPLLKVDAQRHVEIVRMARQEHPQARLMVDANQAWSRALLLELLPQLAALGVELVEQPLLRGQDAELDGLASPIPPSNEAWGSWWAICVAPRWPWRRPSWWRNAAAMWTWMAPCCSNSTVQHRCSFTTA